MEDEKYVKEKKKFMKSYKKGWTVHLQKFGARTAEEAYSEMLKNKTGHNDVQYIEMVQDHVKWKGPELMVLNIPLYY
jgi:hypothetical protein